MIRGGHGPVASNFYGECDSERRRIDVAHYLLNPKLEFVSEAKPKAMVYEFV
jgi:hypothetical protein